MVELSLYDLEVEVGLDVVEDVLLDVMGEYGEDVLWVGLDYVYVEVASRLGLWDGVRDPNRLRFAQLFMEVASGSPLFEDCEYMDGWYPRVGYRLVK